MKLCERKMRKSSIINISNFRTPNTLRIALEKSGEYIGFVRIEEKSTLADVRQVARGDLDDLPKEYTFVLGDGIPVSSRQERRILASSMLPCVSIRPNILLEKVQVHSSEYGKTTGGFTSYVAENTTFRDLLEAAANFWYADPKKVMIQDAEGVAFPLNALVHKFLASVGTTKTDTASKYKLYLENRVAPENAGIKKSISSAKLNLASPADKRTELFRIFTYYCALGDSFELTHLHKRQFVALLKHCNLLNSDFTSAQATIVYTRMARKHKLGFPEFMRAIHYVARNFVKDHDDDENKFSLVLEKHILRLARRWDDEKRQRCKTQLNTFPVMNVFVQFAESLHDIFRFYANRNQFMTYDSYLNFCHDFGMSNMHAGMFGIVRV